MLCFLYSITRLFYFGIIVLVTFVCIYGFISSHFLQAAININKSNESSLQRDIDLSKIILN